MGFKGSRVATQVRLGDGTASGVLMVGRLSRGRTNHRPRAIRCDRSAIGLRLDQGYFQERRDERGSPSGMKIRRARNVARRHEPFTAYGCSGIGGYFQRRHDERGAHSRE